jgi:hypothetical protein
MEIGEWTRFVENILYIELKFLVEQMRTFGIKLTINIRFNYEKTNFDGDINMRMTKKSIQTNVVDDLYVKCCLWWSILTYGILSVPMFLSYECHYQTCSDDGGDESSSRKKRSISALFHIYIYTHTETLVLM